MQTVFPKIVWKCSKNKYINNLNIKKVLWVGATLPNIVKKKHPEKECFLLFNSYAFAATATATATVAPTIGLLPIPITPIIST